MAGGSGVNAGIGGLKRPVFGRELKKIEDFLISLQQYRKRSCLIYRNYFLTNGEVRVLLRSNVLII